MTDITRIIEIPGATETELEEFDYHNDDKNDNNPLSDATNKSNQSNLRNRKSGKQKGASGDNSPLPSQGRPSLKVANSASKNKTRPTEVIFGDDMVATDDRKSFYAGSGMFCICCCTVKSIGLHLLSHCSLCFCKHLQ